MTGDRSALDVVRRGMQLALVAVTVYAGVTTQFGLLANAGVSLLVTLLPEAIERRSDHSVGSGLALWISTAAFLHAVGALGPYQSIPWYDQVAHTVSATLVAGAGYAVVDALDRSSADVEFPAEFRFLFILVFVLAFGVLWEIAEFASGGLASLIGGEAVLAQYGMDDIVLDLLFNGIGALLVALWGTGYFDALTGALTGHLDVLRRRG